MEGGRNEENPVQRERPPEVAAEQLRPPQPQKCPRCDSFNTKFCYYNNYSLSQPRYFCKACRRYWTQGGTLRNVPIGGSCRKSKRARTTSSNNLVARATHGLPPTIRAQSFTGIMGSDQRLVAQPVNSSLFTGGSFLSSLAAMHSLPGNQGISLPPDLKSPTTSYQLQPPSTHYFPPYWSQALINTGSAASSSAAATTSSFWSCNDQTDSSFTPNTHPGFNPSQ